MNAVRRSPGRIAIAVIFAILALNAWVQDILAYRDGDPAAYVVLQALVGAAAALAAIGSWRGASWAPTAALTYGVLAGLMIAMLGPILDIPRDQWSGLYVGGGFVLLFAAGLAWLLRRSLRRARAVGS